MENIKITFEAARVNAHLTQREARKIISDINFDKELLDTKFEVCSNNQLFELYTKVTKYLK